MSRAVTCGVSCIMLVVLMLFGSSPCAGAAVAASPTTGETNRLVEWTFTSHKVYPDPFHDVTLDLLVHCPDGTDQRVPAFWAGAQSWRIRYSSPQTGLHLWKLDCSDHANPDLDGISGNLNIRPYAGPTPLYQHGFATVAKDHRHFQYGDGTPFFWLGDTWWMGLSQRLHWPEDFQKLAADRTEKGFSVIQIVAGLYPDMHPFDPRGANEAGHPWEADYTSINPAYFDAADQRLEYLAEQGLSPCIVGSWGYFLPWMGVEKMKLHWRNLIARYGALPVFWCAAGESNSPFYLPPRLWDVAKQRAGWTEVMRYIRATDPYHRPLTIHPSASDRLSARSGVDDVGVLDFDMLQTPHGQREAVDPTVDNVRRSYADVPVMPVIDGEAAYEMLFDAIPTRWTRQMFWLCMMNGAAGHTYGANGIWQNNRRGDPHGPSPHMPAGSVGYGVIPWDEAMHLPGSTQESQGMKLIEQFPWQTFAPHADWSAYAPVKSFEAAWRQWIWYPDGNPRKDAPVAKRYFRKIVEVPQGGRIAHAQLAIQADDAFDAYVNGQWVGENGKWNDPIYLDISAQLTPGRNLIAVEAENRGHAGNNPAGLIANLSVTTATGDLPVITTDASWLCAKDLPAGNAWKDLAFSADAWVPAMEIGAYGCEPWGRFTRSLYGPYTIGDDATRLIYVPEDIRVQVNHLEAGGRYHVSICDPASGLKTDLGILTSSAEGALTIDPPAQADAVDWVLIVQR